MKRKPLEQLSTDEIITLTSNMRIRLQKKQARERAYLDRRKARGTHTPTDDAYEDDQLLEDELIAFLKEIEQGALSFIAE
jgi:hypothetical protein